MPAKVSTLCYVHNCSDRIAQEFIAKEMTAIIKTDNNDSTNVAFLKTKIFIPINETATHHIGQFEIGDVVFLKGKFITYENYYIVSATSTKVTTLDFDSMPATGINVVVTGFTTQMAKNIEGNMTLEFYIEERIGEREPSDFWLEVRYNANHIYLSNKTNAINQTGHCTNALLVGVI
ncbi:hypothetical protein C2G38_2103757, partial [Gigaspora rosea]